MIVSVLVAEVGSHIFIAAPSEVQHIGRLRPYHVGQRIDDWMLRDHIDVFVAGIPKNLLGGGVVGI